ncbi:ribosome biogenesis GTPase YlqF [Baaleninema simplex]|uniref:ribosome biogenesis GTPase YlqF n=1 Tax=Baaleninema simplex TaxID=2862350 RepID=UPI0003483341|nr:ribosome biogenesis GTPase YlqF [Baaleninema simplex]
MIQWYPGHIAKAERQLQEQLNRVDVVLEVRDARIPLATHHPQLAQWLGEKSRVLILNRVDMIPSEVRQAWTNWFSDRGETAYFTNAKQGTGVAQVAKAAEAVGDKLNERRVSRGMRPRPVRAVVIGFPNVGKSALINRLLRRKVVESARRAGVTRQLRWIRLSERDGKRGKSGAANRANLELLDSPGIIPWRLDKQADAVKLAICEDIGEAAYDNQRIASAMVDAIARVERLGNDMVPQDALLSRYDLDPKGMTGESYLHLLAAERYQNDVERTACQLLNDFRKGTLGKIPLELPFSEEP